MRALALALALLLSASASATELPPPGPLPPTPAELARDRDASIDRGIFNAHAETLGADSWAINSYELFLLGVSYGFTDDIQASITTLLPVVKDLPILFDLKGKFVVYRDATTVMAAQARLLYISHPDEDDAIGTFAGAFLIDHYLDDRGRFAIHGGLQVGGLFGSFSDGGFDVADGAGITFELGVSLGLSDLVKLHLEGWLPAVTTSAKFEFAKFGFVNYGIRFHGESVAADLGFIYPAGDVDAGPIVMGWPFVSFSARL
ncbi:MAG: hypothetical protein CSA66_06600 [Proteobacteria bacterium]|nr:MAG: hypothetical protein CSA66_06600 [Pseudomonadota bacterium]